MELYLFRHGEATPATAGGADAERQLTERGREDVRAVAQALSRAGVHPQAIFTSPLLRARQTGQIIAEVLGMTAEPAEALLPGCRLGDVQSLLAARALDHVMLVGHEPDLSTLVATLIGGGSVRLQTSAVARVDTPSVEPAKGALVWLLTPALVSPAGGGGRE